jgi:hypothetical protein
MVAIERLLQPSSRHQSRATSSGFGRGSKGFGDHLSVGICKVRDPDVSRVKRHTPGPTVHSEIAHHLAVACKNLGNGTGMKAGDPNMDAVKWLHNLCLTSVKQQATVYR